MSCRPAAPDEPVLARVGDTVITAEEFRLNYEFGYGHLRRGDDPRRAYLDYMLLETAMARKARALQLDTLPAIQHAMRTLREELLVEEVFNARVLDAIEVTEDEIREEINKAAVRFQFRFIPAAGEQDARDLYAAVQARGFDAALAERRAELPELDAFADRLTSPLMDAESTDPELLALIQQLPLNTPSEPLQYQGNWYVMEVINVTRTRLSDVDYAQKSPSYRKIIYNRKAMQQGSAFVAETMEPLGVTTKRAGFEILNEALLAWYQAATPERNLLYYLDEEGLDTPYAQQLRAHFDEPLVTYRDAAWTIRDFLAHFTPGRYIIRPDDPRQFKARLADIVALVVRDEVLLGIARDERLDRSPAFQRAMQRWKEKWLFQEYARLLEQEHAPAPDALRAFYEAGTRQLGEAAIPYDSLTAAQRSRLTSRYALEARRRVADSLLAGEEVWIDEHMLDTLTLYVSPSNPYQTVNLLKSNSNKMAFPIVDPNWRSAPPSTPPILPNAP
ncbi:MAG: peptidylprolyl isomerase [Rhodothermales bacterium]